MTEPTAASGVVSRRTALTAGAGLLAGFSLALAAGSDGARAATAQHPGASATTDLARYRPVQVSSTAYAPTPGAFAVDGLSRTGTAGSGWRAEAGDGQWIAVDLQALCTIERVTLTFEAVAGDPTFAGDYSDTDGDEVLSSAATAFALETSRDGTSWTRAFSTGSGQGGVVDIPLAQRTTARWVRLTASARSNGNPLGLNGFEVWGTGPAARPRATGWTSWTSSARDVPALAVAADGTVPLESGWTVTMDDFAPSSDGAALSVAGVDTGDWLRGVVPGTVMAALVAEGSLPDPVGGFENLKSPEALSRHSWWYRREFTLPRGLDAGAGRHVWLEFDGIASTSEVWVNGTRVGTTPNPFVRGVFDVTAALRAHGVQTVAVRVTPMAHPGTPGDKGSDGNTFVQGGHLYLDSPTYLAASGWDWMPAVRDRAAGIWNHVRLRSTAAAVIGDLRVVTTLPGLPKTDRAQVAITVPVRNVEASARSVTVIAGFAGVAVSRTVTVAGNSESEVVFDPADHRALTVNHPKLWWPNGYGDPDLYELTVTTSVGGRRSDERSVRFGIREFSYASEQPVTVPPAAAPDFIVQSGSGAVGQTVALGAQNARYVRLNLGQRATEYGFSIYRLAVLNGDSADLAQGRTATASSTGESWGTPDKAVDGDTTTRWTSDYADDQWIEVDLGAVTAFDTLQIAWESAYALDYVVQVSADESVWTDAASVDNAQALGNSFVQTESFAAQSARYLRIQGGHRATGYGISMWRLSAYDSAHPGTDLALGATATSSSDDGNPASNAVDGKPRTRWSSGYSDDQWIEVDFNTATSFDSIAIDWESAYARDYLIQVSADGSTWTDIKSVDNNAVELKVTVNGVDVFCRGGNWGWDELLRRTDDGRLETAVRLHREMNFTMIRNWLGSSDREELYALCDKYGILLWNDFWEAGQFNDDVPGYLDAVTETIRRYRTHPSIVIWCGANEEEPPAHLGAGMASIVADEDGEVFYIPNSAGGVVSGHGPYYWVSPEKYFDKNTYDMNTFGFHTELGMPVVSTPETMKNLVGDQPGWPIGEVWNYHDWSEIANQRTGTYKDAIDARFGESTSLEQFSTRAQLVNYENHRAMFEAWNANLWHDATGLLLWMSHPAWYSTVWQTYDYDLDVNGAYFGSRKGCEPVHVQASLPSWQLLAVNHTAQDLRQLGATATVYGLDGRQYGRPRRITFDVPASSTSAGFTIDVPKGAPTLHLVRLELRDRHGALLSQNTYWRYQDAGDLGAIERTATKLSVATGKPAHRDGENTLAITVANRGRTAAGLVRVVLRDEHGARVLPAFYDDGYFWLLPGESRTVAVSWTGSSKVRAEASALNAPVARA